MIALDVVLKLRKMAGTHPQGMNHRDYDGKTGGDSTIFSKVCLAVILVLIVIMIIIFLPR